MCTKLFSPLLCSPLCWSLVQMQTMIFLVNSLYILFHRNEKFCVGKVLNCMWWERWWQTGILKIPSDNVQMASLQWLDQIFGVTTSTRIGTDVSDFLRVGLWSFWKSIEISMKFWCKSGKTRYGGWHLAQCVESRIESFRNFGKI